MSGSKSVDASRRNCKQIALRMVLMKIRKIMSLITHLCYLQCPIKKTSQKRLKQCGSLMCDVFLRELCALIWSCRFVLPGSGDIVGRYAVHAGDQLGVQVHEPRHHPFAWQWWHFVVNGSMSKTSPPFWYLMMSMGPADFVITMNNTYLTIYLQ